MSIDSFPQTPVQNHQKQKWKKLTNYKCFPPTTSRKENQQLQNMEASNTTRVFGDGFSDEFGPTPAKESTSRCNKAMKKTVDKKYRRYQKPPYSYVGLIVLAIQSSESKKLKLSEILTRISAMFPFFKGKYQGWRDSIRHNLTQNKCFVKVMTDPTKKHSKGNFWTVNIDLISPDKLKRQNTFVSRNVAPGLTYARDLSEVFDLRTGKLKTSSQRQKLRANHQHFNSDDVSLHSAAGDNWLDENALGETNEENRESFTLADVLDDASVDSLRKCLQNSEENPIASNQVCSTTDSVDCYVTERRSDETSVFNDQASDCSTRFEYSPTDQSGHGPIMKSTGDVSNFVTDKVYCPRAISSLRKKENPSLPLMPPYLRPHPSSLWSSIDETVGPQGPPNVTWYSSAPLEEKVKDFFNDSSLQSTTTARCYPSHSSTFIDQTQFLAEQALVLHGRNDPGSNPMSVAHVDRTVGIRPAFVGNNFSYQTNRPPVAVSVTSSCLTKATIDPRTSAFQVTSNPNPFPKDFDLSFCNFPRRLRYNSHFH